MLIGSFDLMGLATPTLIFAMGSAPAAGTQPDPRGAMISQVGFLVVMVVLFYFVLIRPQSKKHKDHAAMLKTVRKGDRIVTTGGVIGEVITVKDKSISIRSADAKFEITRSAVAEITERNGEASAS
jgi:preprotein translocase subunit YajC